MDPITGAIVAAIASGITKVGGGVVSDAYQGLKALLKRKFGDDSRVVRAVEDVEVDQESSAYQAVLKEQVAKSGAGRDSEIQAAAQKLLEVIGKQPGGEQLVQQATGSYIQQLGHGSQAHMNINVPEKKTDG